MVSTSASPQVVQVSHLGKRADIVTEEYLSCLQPFLTNSGMETWKRTRQKSLFIIIVINCFRINGFNIERSSKKPEEKYEAMISKSSHTC